MIITRFFVNLCCERDDIFSININIFIKVFRDLQLW